MTDRISWDEYFYSLIHLISQRSVCLRRKVGCLVVKNNQILCTGYNGPPAGHPHPEDIGGCERDIAGIKSGERLELCVCLHAEQNAILQAARHGISIEGATIYVTIFPCPICARMIANAGISEVRVFGNYPGEESSKRMLDYCKVKITHPDTSDFRERT
jgi:dCMP deaminase